MPYAFGYTQLWGEQPHEFDETIRGYYEIVKLTDTNLEWAGLYCDSVHRPFCDRPNGSRMNQQLHSGDHVLITSLYRAFNGIIDGVRVMVDWKNRGVVLHVVDIGMDTDEHDGRDMLRHLTVARDWWSACMEVKKGLDSKPRLKGSRRSIPMGFMTDRKRIVPDEDEQAVMARIVDWAEQSYSYAQIERFLAKHKVTRRGGGRWTADKIGQAYRAAKKLGLGHGVTYVAEPASLQASSTVVRTASSVTPLLAGQKTILSLPLELPEPDPRYTGSTSDFSAEITGDSDSTCLPGVSSITVSPS